jgi:hypothetical protein
MSIYTDGNIKEFAQLFRAKSNYVATIVAEGEETPYDGRIQIRTCDILSRLIVEAGRFCDSYASDLFIDWQSLEEELEAGTIKTGIWLFGFKEHGVDHDNFIFSHLINNPYGQDYYRSVWRLDVDVHVRVEDRKKEVTMKLYRVSCPGSWEIREFKQAMKEQEVEA